MKHFFISFFAILVLMTSFDIVTRSDAQTTIEKRLLNNSVPGATSARDTKAEKARLTGFHVVGTDDSVRLVLDVSADVRSSNRVLAAPYRLVIDLPDVEFDLKSNRSNASPGFLTKVNFGTTDENLARLVIETSVPFVVEKSFATADSAGGGGRRLVFDLVKSTETAFRIAAVREAQAQRLQQEERSRSDGVRQPFVESAGAERAAKADIAKPHRKRRIVIDPGHGGKDGGAMTVAGVLEKEIVLSFSHELAEKLRSTGEFDVTLTRNDDRFVSLNERVRTARDRDAELFVSIHADSLPEDRRVRGTAVYTISERASDVMAARIAAEQNKSDAIAGHEIINGPDAVIDILFDLTRRETSNLSIVFARHFFADMKSQISFFKKPLQRAAFTVLRVPDIPSVLIELGFLSNDEDAKLLSSNAWREETAAKMAATIAGYFDKPIDGFEN